MIIVILKFLLVIVIAGVAGLLSANKKVDRVLGLVLSGVIVLIGIAGLVSGRIPQRWRAGPDLEGPLATLGSMFILAVGLYTIYQIASEKRKNRKGMK